jgi:hypothetical protein
MLSINKMYGPDGDNSTPSHSFSSDTNTGIYSSESDVLSFATGGIRRMFINNTTITPANPLRAPTGSSSAPSYSFSDETNTGMFSGASNTIGLAVGGVSVFSADATTITTDANIIPLTTATDTLGSETIRFNSIYGGGISGTVTINTGATLTLDSTHYFLRQTTASSTYTIPLAALHDGRTYHITNEIASGTVTINRSGSDTFDGNTTTISLSSQYDHVSLISNGHKIWYII